MKRFLLLPLSFSAVIFSQSVLAEGETHWYLGAGIYKGNGTEEVNSDGGYYDYSIDYDAAGNRFSIGFMNDNDNRLEISYVRQRMKPEGYEEQRFHSVDADAVATFFKAHRLRPYLGIGLGFATYADSGQYIEGGKNQQGLSFQLAAGLMYRIIAGLEVDISGRYRGIGWETLETDLVDYSLNTSVSTAEASIRYIF